VEEVDLDYRTAAKLVLSGADKWSDQGRQDIATWLHKQADFLIEEGEAFSDKYEAFFKFRPTADEGR